MTSRSKAARRISARYRVYVEWNPLTLGNGRYWVNHTLAGHTIVAAERLARQMSKETKEEATP